MKVKKRFLFVICGLLLVVITMAFRATEYKKSEMPPKYSRSNFEYKMAQHRSTLHPPPSNFHPLPSNPQPPTSKETDSFFTLIKTITLEAKDIQTDRLGNLYVVSKTNQLYKYGSNGKLLSTLNYKYLGNITHVDATNPLEIFVFYKELNTVVFLDNNLAYRGEMKLADFGVGQATAIARSFDNGIWVFDLADMQLKKMDKNGENLQTSGNIRQYISQNGAVTYIYDDNEYVFVNDSVNGVLVFNVFGTYLKTLPIKGCVEIKVIENIVYYWQTSQLKKYQLKTFVTQAFSIPDSANIKDVSIEKERLYLLKPNEVSIYGF